MSDSFNKVPDYQKPELFKHLEEKQMADSLKMYNKLVEDCFDKCVTTGWGGGIRSKNLTDAEQTCVTQCSEKFMKLTQRVGFRFAEYSSGQQQGK
jgi:import inner membrane translocase subunit TIM9